ncbi:MAG: hypothetical protein ACRDRV_14780 [Pseudonocardiaceae bacterium]
MDREAVPTSSVLFGTDGTQLPDPLPVLPDALTGPEHSVRLRIPELSAVPLPPLPDGRAMQAAITAVLADDPAAHVTRPVRNPPAHPAPGRVPQRPPAPAGTLRPTPLPPHADRLQSRSSGGVRTGCIIALIIIGVVVFNIIAAIMQAISALFS